MPIDLSGVDLDSKAFGSEVEPTEEGTAETSPVESPRQESPTSEGQSDEEARIPYSRFREVNEAKRDAERQAQEAEERYQELLNSQRSEERSSPQSGDIPSWWEKMYGQNENSKEAFKYWQQGQEEIRNEARREALDAVRNERQSETRALVTNERVIDDRLEDLSGSLGRNLSESEESALLDIIDDYTPKDADGNYAGDLIPFDKAWEIYELKQGQSGQRTRQARSAATSATSQRSQGEPTGTQKSNENWNPLDWNSWKKRIPQG